MINYFSQVYTLYVNIANSWKTLFYTVMHAYYKDFYLQQQIHVYILNHYFEL